MQRAYGYVRVSGPSQTKGHGPERQRDLIRGFCDRRYEVVGWYDDSFTGTEAERPEFVRMFGDMLECGVRVVVVESLDRFSRDLLVQCSLLAKLAERGIDLIAANTGENVTQGMREDPMRDALVKIQGVFSELERKLIVRKLRLAKEARRRRGEVVDGNPRYGSLEGEAAVAERIWKLRRYRKLSYLKIAALLNREGVPTRGGGPWRASVVQQVCKRGLAQV